MCGISGYLDMASGVDTAVLRRMNDVIRHRGPDDEGYALIGPGGAEFFSGPDTLVSLPPLPETAGAFLGLGHRRLSILDLSESGHQPMCLPERGITVVYNGEIYNFIELRQELEAKGYAFRTACDTEVLLYAYCEWGEDCLSHFNGMWGFALWDGLKRKLFCARDRLGAKPFHYWRQGDKLLFGSELKQLCQDGGVPRHFNRSYLAANLMYRLSDYNEQTLIEGMRVLKPGHKLIVRLSADLRHIESIKAAPYWELKTGCRRDVSPREWKERVAAEFARSCRWRLRSDAPLAALLSGGLDSSCMVTELCGQMPDPAALETFTTSYLGHAECDEWNFADMVNQACGCRGHLITPDLSNGIEKRYETLIWHLEGNCGLDHMGGKYLMDELHRRGFKVVLNGQCGDETMFGYERYYAYYFLDLLKKGHPAKMLREYLLASKHSAMSAARLLGMFAYFNIPAIRRKRQLRRVSAFVRRELLESRNREELHRLMYPHSLQDLQKTELTATQLTHIVRYDDRMYMSASIESRIPFMDYRFVELSAQIPPELKIKNGYTKNIMREVFDSRMPKAVTWRTNKMGFGAPVDLWRKQFSQEYLSDRIHNAKSRNYFQIDKLSQLVSQRPDAQEIFDFLLVEEFARLFGVD